MFIAAHVVSFSGCPAIDDFDSRYGRTLPIKIFDSLAKVLDTFKRDGVHCGACIHDARRHGPQLIVLMTAFREIEGAIILESADGSLVTQLICHSHTLDHALADKAMDCGNSVVQYYRRLTVEKPATAVVEALRTRGSSMGSSGR